MTKIQEEPKIVIVDVDAVSADIHHQWLKKYNEDYKDTLCVEVINDWDMTKFVKPECGKGIYKYLNDPKLYDEMPPIEGALAGVDALRQRDWRVVFCTSTPLGSSGRKLTWLREHGFLPQRPGGIDTSPSPDYFEGADKSLLRGHLIIDDYLENLRTFPGDKIAFAQPWNVLATEMGIPRAKGWDEVLNLVAIIDRAREVKKRVLVRDRTPSPKR